MSTSSSHGRFRLTPRRLSLVPRFAEPIEPEFYRLTGKVRFILVTIIVITNFLGGLSAGDLGYDADFYWQLMVPINGLAALDLGLAGALWRGRCRLLWMRRLALLGLVAEVATILLATWAHGSTSSHFVLFGVITILTYRVVFDFAAGAVAAVMWLVGHWAMVISEVAGLIPHQPVFGGAEVHTQRHLSAVFMVSIVTVVSFFMGNWTVARLRHKEIALRILRQTLAAQGDGKLGRHTGSTLRDTYEVGTLLGTGGMGEVYRGRHVRTSRDVAIKVLHPHLVDDDVLMRRFRREAEITGQLGSRNIVEIIDVDRDGDIPFLVLELLEGEDLATHLQREGTLALELAAPVLDQIAEGLAVAHEAGIVHRDLKPENLYLCRGSELLVKILDFGVSKIRGNATAITREIALIGTPDFMSPEQATAMTEDVDARTDVFALGGIAYTMLTGQRPFAGGSVPAILRRICDEEPPAIESLRDDVPRQVVDVIAIAMAKVPGERYQSVSELRDDLSAAFRGQLAPAVSQRALVLTRGRPPSKSVRAHADVGVDTPTMDVSGTAPTTVDAADQR